MTLVPGNMELKDLPYAIHRNLCTQLEKNNSWLLLATYLRDKGVHLDIEYIAAQRFSSRRLLGELSTRIFNINALCKVLDNCKLYHALAVLKHPEPLRILSQPGNGKENMQVALGGTLELCCEAYSLPPPTYQWFRDNEQLTDATSSQLIVTDFGLEHEGQYFCHIKTDGENPQNECSCDVVVSVAPILPEIIEQPEGVNKQEGESVCLKCIAEGHPKPAYQWYKGNKLLDGRNENKLYINYAKPSDSEMYQCVVTNEAGEVFSEKVRVQVNHADIPVVKPSERCIAKEKLALLIGNVKYDNHDCLVKPVDDVVLLSKQLSAIGFKVITLVNLKLVEMKNAVRQFANQLVPGVYGLFYFGGHGIQTDEPLMLPVDAPKSEYGPQHCLSEKDVRDMMLSNGPMLRVIILDMCLKPPDSPILSSRHKVKSFEEVGKKPDINLIIAHSTSGNLSAYERRSESNGTYVKYLSQFINEEITMMGVFQKTHEAIHDESMKMKYVTQWQIPRLSNNVYKKFCFTDAVSGDSNIEQFFNNVYVPPKSEELDFKLINIDPKPKAHYFRHRDCILNIIDIQLKGIDLNSWKIKVCSEKEILKMKDVPIKESQEKEVYQITVEELQGPAVAGYLNFTINLNHQDCLIDSTQLFLRQPLVAKWFLYVES